MKGECVVYIERGIKGFLDIDVADADIKVTSGSKIRAYKKFGVYDDDLDLAHRFVVTSKRFKRGVLVAFDDRVTDFAESLIDDSDRDRIALVNLRVPYTHKVELSWVLKWASPGYYTRIQRDYVDIPSRFIRGSNDFRIINDNGFFIIQRRLLG